MERTITALSAQKRNPQRVNVFLDGEFAFGLARIVAAWLHVGQVISEEKIKQLQEEDSREVAYQRALSYLSYRQRTEAEVRINLEQHGIRSDIIQEVIQRLQRSGLLDDVRFARDWIENRNELRPRGQRALIYELKQKGVDPEIIADALQDLDEEQLAYQAASKQAHRLRNLEWEQFRKKLLGFLARRGFDYETSNASVSRVWAELKIEKNKSIEEDTK